MKCTAMTESGSMASTPDVAEMIDTFGGLRYESVSISHDELKHFRKLFGMGPSSSVLAKVRDDLTACRIAANHGLRIMAFLARHLEPDEDPVKLVAKMAIAYGLDVCVDPDWIDDETMPELNVFQDMSNGDNAEV